MNSEQLLADLLERIQNRFFGKYRGVVSQVDEATLRVKAKVPSVLGDQDSGWATPCVPYAGDQVGMAFLPEVGAGVWIEFEGGDVSFPIWAGCYWRSGEIPSQAKPKAKAIVTNRNAVLVIDDDQGTVELRDNNQNKVTLSSEGIVLERSGKKVAVLTDKVAVNDGGLEVI